LYRLLVHLLRSLNRIVLLIHLYTVCSIFCSVTDKIDDVVELRRDVSADVVCLVETWHDSDGLPLNRLRSVGYTVVDRPRPRLRSDLSSNHGGIVIFYVPGVRLTVLPFDSTPSFGVLRVRIISGCSSDILVVSIGLDQSLCGRVFAAAVL
jgi:hypothetical protein